MNLGKDLHVSRQPRAPELAQRFRELRRLLGLKQEQVAEAGGLRRNEISQLEGGENKVTSERFVSGLARGLGVSEDVVRALRDGRMPVEDAAATATRREPALETQTAPALAAGIRARAQSRWPADYERRERRWLAVGLIARGVPDAVAYKTAMTMEWDYGGASSPEEILDSAEAVARVEMSESKGKNPQYTAARFGSGKLIQNPPGGPGTTPETSPTTPPKASHR